VAQKERKQLYGQALVNFSIAANENHFNSRTLKISAQLYLHKFHQSHGFSVKGTSYLEDEISHIRMLKS
jgi:ElaA protein